MKKRKKCSKCRKTLSIDSFYRDRSKKDGRRGVCRACRRKSELTNWKRLSFNRARSRAKAAGKLFTLEFEDVHYPDVCPVYGIPLVYGAEDSYNSPSFDKFYPEKGYVKGNVNVISKLANTHKSNSTLEESIQLLKWRIKEMRLTGVKIPPVNLYSITEIMYLLSSYPMLAGDDELAPGVEMVYNRATGGHIGARFDAQSEVKKDERHV